MNEAAPSLAEILGHWSLNIPWMVALVGAAALYGWAFRRARSIPSAHPHPVWKLLAFLGSLVLVGLAVLSPVERYGNQVLWVDFLGFLLLTMMAAPLMVLSSPLTLAFRVTGPAGRRRLRRFYRSWLLKKLSFPVASWLIFAVVTYLWQFTAMTDDAATNGLVRGAQQSTLFLVSYLFWMPALCADPLPWRMPYPLRALYVFVEMTHKALFGGMFLATTHTFHRGFSERLPEWSNLTPLYDQRVAILVLWTGGSLIFVAVMIALIVGWQRYERRNAHRVDWRLALVNEQRKRKQAALDQVFRRGV
jgi:cytochrome c oxidase assembly factor CtaG